MSEFGECVEGNEDCPGYNHRRPCLACKAHYWRTSGHSPFSVPTHFRQEMTQREIARDIFDNARRTGTEIERAR